MILMDLAFSPLIHFLRNELNAIKVMHLIRHSVKFLPKLIEIKGDKNFLKRGEVDVIKFSPLITILLILMAQ